MTDSRRAGDAEFGWYTTPEIWLWFLWKPQSPLLAIGRRPPDLIGSAHECAYEAVLQIVGDAPVRVLTEAEVDLMSLVRWAGDSDLIDQECRGCVASLLAELENRAGGKR